MKDEIIFGDETIGNGDIDRTGIPGIIEYKPRLLGALGENSAIIVPESTVPIAHQTRDLMVKLGIICMPPENIIGVPLTEATLSASIIASIGKIKARLSLALSKAEILPYISSGNIERISRELGLESRCLGTAADKANNKGWLLDNAPEFGIATAPGITIKGEDSSDLQSQAWGEFKKLRSQSKHGIVWCKLTRACSGQGVKGIKTDQEFAVWLEDRKVKYQLKTPGFGIRLDQDIWTPETVFPNVLIWIGKKPSEDRFINASYQILHKDEPEDKRRTVHTGNMGPIPHHHLQKLIQESQKVANQLRSINAYGHAGIDFLSNNSNSTSPTDYLLEVNFRVNGNSGQAMMAHDLGVTYWGAHNNVKAPLGSTLEDYHAHLIETGNLWNLDTQEGIIPINPTPSYKFGKVQVLVTGSSRKMVADLLQSAHSKRTI